MKLLALLALVNAQQLNLGWTYLIDDGGPDDVVAQSDVNYMGFNKDAADYALVSWSWDDTNYPGKNSGDGCSLWDLNKNGNADFALCVSVQTDPVTLQVSQTSTQLFACADTRFLTCPQECNGCQPGYTVSTLNHSNMYPTATGTVGTVLKSYCWVDFMPDPFVNYSSHVINAQNYTTDTRATCKLYYDELKKGVYPNGAIMPGDPQLINVCSYPSASPTSNQKDCVVTGGSGFLIINKWVNTAANCTTYQAQGLACGGGNPEAFCTLYNCTGVPKVQWNFTYASTVISPAVTKTSSIYGWGWSPIVAMPAATYSVSEGTLPSGWVQIGFRCADNQTDPLKVVVASGQTLVCYFVNYFGTKQQFTNTYGPVTNGSFGNITLDQYVPPRTYAPTPQGAPTPACPTTSLSTFFTTCTDLDFANAAQCSPTCLNAANALQLALGPSPVAVQDTCTGQYNTDNGLPLSSLTMNLISIRIDSLQPICSSGNAPCPSSLASLFSACTSGDFATGASCSASCLAAASTVQTDYASVPVATQSACLVNYNTVNGGNLSSANLDTITARINAVPQQKICSTGGPSPTNQPAGKNGVNDGSSITVSSFLVFFFVFSWSQI